MKNRAAGSEDPITVEVLRDFGALGVMLAGLAYASGFVVFHVYIGRVGLFPFELWSVQYLAAGFLFIFSTALVWLPIGAGKVMVKPTPHSRLIPHMTTYLFVISSGLFLASRVFDLIGLGIGDTIYWMSVAGIPFLILIGATWRKIQLFPTESIFTRLLVIGVVPSLLIWTALTVWFAINIYPHIYREFGGGRPVKFELTIKRENQTLRSGIYDILAVTDRYWLIREAEAGPYFLVSSEQVKTAKLVGPARFR